MQDSTRATGVSEWECTPQDGSLGRDLEPSMGSTDFKKGDQDSGSGGLGPQNGGLTPRVWCKDPRMGTRTLDGEPRLWEGGRKDPRVSV